MGRKINIKRVILWSMITLLVIVTVFPMFTTSKDGFFAGDGKIVRMNISYEGTRTDKDVVKINGSNKPGHLNHIKKKYSDKPGTIKVIDGKDYIIRAEHAKYAKFGETPIYINAHGFLGGQYLLFYRDSFVTLKGTGFVHVRWEVEYWQANFGDLNLPEFKLLNGIFYQIGEGGQRKIKMGPTITNGVKEVRPATAGDRAGHEFDISLYGKTESPAIGWINKYYYLDGTLRITDLESKNNKKGVYNLGISMNISAEMIMNEMMLYYKNQPTTKV
jgi:hypothetical protein